MATVLPELLLQKTLQKGLAAFKADATILKEVFSYLSPEELKEYATFFRREAIEVRLGRPPRGPDLKLPIVVIESAGEEEIAEQDTLDDFFNMESDDATQTTYRGTRMRASFNVYALAKDNRQARLLYRSLLTFLILYRHDFEMAGFQNRRIAGNKDMDVDLGADPVEAKLLTLSGEYWFAVGISERLLASELYVTVTSNVTPVVE